MAVTVRHKLRGQSFHAANQCPTNKGPEKSIAASCMPCTTRVKTDHLKMRFFSSSLHVTVLQPPLPRVTIKASHRSRLQDRQRNPNLSNNSNEHSTDAFCQNSISHKIDNYQPLSTLSIILSKYKDSEVNWTKCRSCNPYYSPHYC